jgi:hypothetical protein
MLIPIGAPQPGAGGAGSVPINAGARGLDAGQYVQPMMACP